MSEAWGPSEFVLQNYGGALRVLGREYKIDEWRLECGEERAYYHDPETGQKEAYARGMRSARGKLEMPPLDDSCLGETATVRLDDGSRAWSFGCVITFWWPDMPVGYTVAGAISPDPWTEFALKGE